ncbi:deoxyguanosinetriphosphate triphosphohydrolase [Mumia zhuanghuii]|uniref:Deoxyguanosinetriphosphate triphosphohydrolase-like protein n=2 Tax=Mumia TaxID=1546255 RepID=A0ABW1QJZ4_9ACTN|nr:MULTISPECIES: deoxyguanosinetriphosphate triphosphohydrolase [Mumia]KAA1423609.1 deoxyguanosinetriphosphate triphosphohydrolase [Mumia zhuanghuii]
MTAPDEPAPSSSAYPPAARARIVAEPPKRAARTPFERDRARILHSSALRRLAAKTQVVGPGTDDFVRNRLTHSLEVAQVARELGKSLGCDPDVVDSAALAHDLGHPPFGHNGERALDEAAASCGGFEGNAQTLRLLSRLEAKTFDAEGRSVGLNLTRATLDACTKYPWTRDAAPVPEGAHGDGSPRLIRKFGVYDDDLPVFSWVRDGAPGARRCIEAQVMDLSDDIAYCVHDVEDGVVSDVIDLRSVRDDFPAICATVREWYVRDARDDDLDAAYGRLVDVPGWPTAPYDGSRRAQASLKSLTSALVGRFVAAAHDATLAAFGPRPFVRYEADLVVPDATRDEIAVLKAVAAHYVMRADDRVALLAEQRALLRGLVDALVAAGPDRLEPPFATDARAAETDAARLRVVVDQVASLTDESARAWGRRLL